MGSILGPPSPGMALYGQLVIEARGWNPYKRQPPLPSMERIHALDGAEARIAVRTAAETAADL
jgi:hypothetical protein